MHIFEEQPEKQAKINKKEALQYLEEMIYIRRIEINSSNMYKAKQIRGFCHLYNGQEAVSVGMVAAMRDIDSVITAYRCHGWAYLMGLTSIEILAELAGRKKGCSRGKGGSMHMYGKKFFGGNGIVGAQVPIGAGVALANKYTGNGGVCITLYGDGASNQGQVFESFNLAFLLNLPVIFVCENNLYGMGTSAKRSSQNTKYYTRGDNIPGIWVDGMDVLSVKNATTFAIEHATTVGPIVMEMHTYRYHGHSMSDPGTSYRTRDEIDEVRKTRDPITSFGEQMKSCGLLTADEIKGIEKKVRADVDKITKEALDDKEVVLEEIAHDLELNCLDSKIRGAVGFNLTHKRINKQFVEDKLIPLKTAADPKPARLFYKM